MPMQGIDTLRILQSENIPFWPDDRSTTNSF